MTTKYPSILYTRELNCFDSSVKLMSKPLFTIFHVSRTLFSLGPDQYRGYHVNSPPFLAGFGVRSKTGFKGKY